MQGSTLCPQHLYKTEIILGMGKEKVTPLLFYKGAYGLSYDLSMMAKLIFYIYLYLSVCVCRCMCREAPGTCGDQGSMSEVIVNHDVPCCLKQDLLLNLKIESLGICLPLHLPELSLRHCTQCLLIYVPGL